MRRFLLLTSIFFAYSFSISPIFASTQANDTECIPADSISIVNPDGFSCSGAQDFPDDGNGNIPVSFSSFPDEQNVIPNLPDDAIQYGFISTDPSDPTVLLNSSSADLDGKDYTVLGIHLSLYNPYSNSDIHIQCADGLGVHDYYFPRIIPSSGFYSSSFISTANLAIHCEAGSDFNLYNVSSTQFQGTIWYVPRDTRDTISTSTMPVSDTHFVIISGFIIAFATMITIIWLFKRKI